MLFRTSFLSLVGSVAFAALSVQTAFAQSEAEQERLKQIEQQLQENERKSEAIRAAAEQRSEDLQGLTSNLIDAANSLRVAEERASSLEASLAELEKNLAVAEVDLEAKQASLSNILAALLSMELSQPPALAVAPEDASEAARAAIALSSVVPELRERAKTLQLEIAEVQTLRTQKNEERAELANVERALSTRKSLYAELRDQKEEEVAKDSELVARLARENARLVAQATSIRDLMQGITASTVTETLQPRLAPRASSLPTSETSADLQKRRELLASLPAQFTSAKGKIPSPVVGQVSSKYGSRTASGQKLDGVRFKVKAGNSVTAPFAGTVQMAGNMEDYGNILILDVGEGYYFVLLGMADNQIAKGSVVQAGEPLGTMPPKGDSGEETFELFLQVRETIAKNVTEPVNPALWLANL